MNKTLIALAIAAAGMAVVPVAFAQSAPQHDDGWFVNGQVGQVEMSNNFFDGHDTGYQLTGGYRWEVAPSTLLGVEAGYNDLGNIDVENAFNDNEVINDAHSELHGWMLGGTGHFNLNPHWYVSARAGIYLWKGQGLSNTDTPVLHDLDKTDWYTGVGFGYDLSDAFSVGLNYDYYHAEQDNVDLSTDMISVGAEYRF